jgi:hypothetical protein
LRVTEAVRRGLLLLALCMPPAWAQAQQSPPPINATLRAAVSSSNRLLDDREPVAPLSVALRARMPLHEGSRLVFDAEVGNRAQAGASRLAALREAYAEWRSQHFDLGAGRQVLAWGRADGINPTDYFGARDYTRMVAEDDEQRRGVDVMRLRWHGSVGTLQAVLEPSFTPTVIPSRSRAGVQVQRGVRGDRRLSWALKYDIEGSAYDASLSYYDGLERLPDLTPLGMAGTALLLGEVHPRVQTLGADVATTLGGWALRAEMAFMQTPDREGDAPFVRNRQLQVVLGAEHRLPDDLVIYGQLFAKRVLGFRSADVLADPTQAALARAGMAVVDQASARRAGLSVRLTKRWSETWSAEITVLAAWPQRDAIWRPRLVMRPDDHWRWTLGADVFRGPATSTFGQLRDNSNATLGVERFF